MLLKILASLTILGASGVIGYSLSRNCARRPGELRLLQGLLQMFENEIGFLSSVLAEAFDKIYRAEPGPVAKIFRDTGELLRREEAISAADAWEAAVNKNIGITALNGEDAAILIAFGRLLGRSDAEGQIKNIRLTLNQLKIQEQKAEEQRRKNGSLYRNLGVLGGLAIVIILF